MINYDLHIHNETHDHAVGMTIPVILKRADQLNLDTIAITTHIFKHEDLPTLEKIRNDVAAIKTNCRVILGAEIDVDGQRWDGSFVTDSFDGIDYIVAGFHYIPGFGNYPFSPADNPMTPEELFARWRSTILGIVSNPKIHTLAHPARLIAMSIDLDIYFERILEVFSEAAQISAKNNIIWEINEQDGPRIPAGYDKQWHRIYQIALDAGLKIIYGSDAHNPESIALQDFTQIVLNNLPQNSLSTPESIKIFKS